MPAPDSSTYRELVVSDTDSGARLDRFVAAHCSELSRTRVQELIESGQVRPVIDRTYPLSQIPQAIQYLRDGHAQGKVVVNL